ncbi:hypothetical protein [Arthrobacter yangruifuii]|uniref:hypothetical protein n=1 Tax=Arthrobacter yangruifuii TaxID=2606616 RepID=UPI001FEFA421|nr:hypothetical protein [Arthrobacter yangruifuii]
MKLLILGGTAWLGHQTALSALSAGHDVTCAARGTSGTVPDGVRFLPADREDDGGLSAAAQQEWDAVIDVSRQPGQVRRAVRDLAPSAGSTGLSPPATCTRAKRSSGRMRMPRFCRR